jgi:hypothetical protein
MDLNESESRQRRAYYVFVESLPRTLPRYLHDQCIVITRLFGNFNSGYPTTDHHDPVSICTMRFNLETLALCMYEQWQPIMRRISSGCTCFILRWQNGIRSPHSLPHVYRERLGWPKESRNTAWIEALLKSFGCQRIARVRLQLWLAAFRVPARRHNTALDKCWLITIVGARTNTLTITLIITVEFCGC